MTAIDQEIERPLMAVSVSSENPRNAVICIHGTGSGEKGHSPACNMMNNLTAVPRTGSGAPVSANR
jgi:hypothetical protein